MDGSVLRLHAFVPDSGANGPGRRAVLWVQGCTLGCPGCFNPATHPADGGEPVRVAVLLERLRGLGTAIGGITVSGGEPLQQLPPLLALLQAVRRQTSLTSLVFTGYTWSEIQRLPRGPELAGCVDVLIAGRYLAARRLATGLLGSANKAVHFFTDRYGPADLAGTPVSEVQIDPDGNLLVSGIDPPDLGG